MNGKTIEIVFWRGVPLEGLPWKNFTLIKNESKKKYHKKLKKLLAKIEDAGYNVMVLYHKNYETSVFIDDGYFRQR